MTKTYRETMEDLNAAAYAALRAAGNADGAPVDALREIAAEIDSLIDHGVTRAEMRDMLACTKAQSWRGWCDDNDSNIQRRRTERDVRRSHRALRLRREGSPVWDEVNPDSIEILHFDILGIDVDPRILPQELQRAIFALSNEVEFE
jgi:hypothetical protein